MFKPFSISRSSWVSISIFVTPMSDVRFVGRRKETFVRVRYLTDGFDKTELIWAPSRITREHFVRDFVEDRAKSILAELDDRLCDGFASQES
jgi:hypothetical protein